MPASEPARGAWSDAARAGALALAHGVLLIAAFPPIGIWPAALAAPLPLAWIGLGGGSLRRALPVVLVITAATWLWLDRWLVDVTAVGWPLLAVYMALYPAAFVAIVRRLDVLGLPMTLVVPVTWIGLEYLRGSVAFDGYPWYLLAQPLAAWPPAVQSADLLGGYFVGFLAALPSGLVLDLTIRRRGRRRAVVATAAVAAALAAHLAYGAWRLGQPLAEDGPAVLAIQTNLPQDNKIGWTPEQQVEDFRRFRALTRRAHAEVTKDGGRVDLVVWPETMLPGFGLEPETIEFQVARGFHPGDAYAEAITALQADLGPPLLVGSPAFIGLDLVDDRWRWDRHLNSAYLLDGRWPAPRYDKVFLTPFGETMPYISRWPWLEERLLAIGARGMSFSLDAADETVRLDTAWRTRRLTLGTPICFEDTVPSVCRRTVHADGVKRVDVLVNLSNDGWFGAHDAGRQLHALIARLRCVENRVPMIRAANTGVSVSIDSTGKVRSVLGAGRYGEGRREGWVYDVLPLDARSTLYGRVGDVAGLVALIATAVGTVVAVRRGRRPAGRQSPREEPRP
jgi:apolipoprotein N-acyltransferase